MEDRLDLRLQLRGHHRLRDPVGDSRHAEHPRARRHAASGSPPPAPAAGSTIPEDIRFQILYRLFFRSVSNSAMRQPVHPGAPLFALTFSHASQTARFEISNGLPGDFQLVHATPPGASSG